MGSAGADTDHRALMQFRSLITDDPHGALASWGGSGNASAAPCGWRGVTCGARGRVTALDIRGLGLSGTIAPSSLAGLTYLRRLDLAENRLTGGVPSLLPPSLERFNLSHNALQGPVPTALGSLRRLQTLSLAHNDLTGTIPASLGNLTSLTDLSLTGNNLVGAIPDSLGNLQSLTGLYLSLNMLQGSIPPVVFNLSSLQKLVVQYNNLTGTLPSDAIGKLPSLWLLVVDSNQLHGAIPVSLCNASRLEFIQMTKNSFSGVIPACLGALNNLQALTLDANQLEANVDADWRFMDSLTNCSNMMVLGLSENKLGGVLPASIVNLSTTMELLGLWGNMVSGQIPQEIGNLVNLRDFEMQHNNFTGTIPASLGRLYKLSKLYLHGNRLSGQIPPTIGNLTVLSSLILDNNTLTGLIPSSLGSCPLEMLSLDNNRLTGPIPKQVLLISTLFYVSFPGAGSFGSVYKGTMMIDNQEVVVAVKVLNLQQRGASESFIAECETLRCARHRNLVKILTVCSSFESSGLDFKALVFDFLPNGNLDQWLYISEHGSHGGLDLAQRIDIAIDVASALEYLHNYKPAPIVHCDLKPSNILLDNDMVAHVGDFGLARFVHQDQTSLSDISSGWATRRGTIGYAAPEYGLGNGVSIHGDIYSFGVLLLEIFTGKRPTDSSFVDDLNLHSYVQLALQDQRVASVVDQRLLLIQDQKREGRKFSSNSTTELVLSCITSVLKIGILCSKEVPTDRLVIGDALRELHGVKERYNRIHD